MNTTSKSFSYMTTKFTTTHGAYHRAHTNVEKRGKSHLKEVSKVLRKIAVKDIDFLKQQLEKEPIDDEKENNVIKNEPFDE